MLTEQEINTIATFMQRVTLQPAEIQAFQGVMQALGREVQNLRVEAITRPPSPEGQAQSVDQPEPPPEHRPV